MIEQKHYDVIIIGGSYAGLQAAMTLGRALKNVLLIDSGNPCNVRTPHSHNFLTQDGQTPTKISAAAKIQLVKYSTVSMLHDTVTNVVRCNNIFKINTIFEQHFTSRKILFATGVRDIMPDIDGFSACWGVSVIHCPYCHGYEVRNEATGVLANGDTGYEFAKLINNWTKKLTLFTNGTSTLNNNQKLKLESKNISVIETPLRALHQNKGYMEHLIFKDGSHQQLTALYARVPFEQHCNLPLSLGCGLNEHGLFKADSLGKTNIAGVYVAGDNSSLLRSVAGAVASGMAAGAAINKELIEDDF